MTFLTYRTCQHSYAPAHLDSSCNQWGLRSVFAGRTWQEVRFLAVESKNLCNNFLGVIYKHCAISHPWPNAWFCEKNKMTMIWTIQSYTEHLTIRYAKWAVPQDLTVKLNSDPHIFLCRLTLQDVHQNDIWPETACKSTWFDQRPYYIPLGLTGGNRMLMWKVKAFIRLFDAQAELSCHLSYLTAYCGSLSKEPQFAGSMTS